MMTVKELSRRSGCSIRTLRYYHEIGLLPPVQISHSGYRFYDETSLERLQMILLFRELEFSLKEIHTILNSSDYDKNRILEQQITLLQLKKDHLQNLIDFAKGLKLTGMKNLDFQAFDTTKIDEYTSRAKALWGKTDAYREFEEKEAHRSKEDNILLEESLMEIFKKYGELRQSGIPAESCEAQKLTQELQSFITDNFYHCTLPILRSLGKMYSGGGSFTENIDRFGGTGTAAFADKTIAYYCDHQK